MSNIKKINEVTAYIQNNYLTLEQLAKDSGVSPTKLAELIDYGCIPKHSHTMTKQVMFSTDIFGESIFTEEKTFYYHPSLIDLAKKANQLTNENFKEVAKKMKADFADELCQALVEIEAAKQIFDFCFDDDGNLLMNKIEKIISEHWSYLMDGTYGVCLKKISAKNIILKKIAVSMLENWLNESLKNKNHEQASYAADLYDKVASEFGPHEILKSTRDRLFNKFNSNLAS